MRTLGPEGSHVSHAAREELDQGISPYFLTLDQNTLLCFAPDPPPPSHRQDTFLAWMMERMLSVSLGCQRNH